MFAEEQMGNITDYQHNQPTYHEGQINTVLSVTPVQTYAVRFTDGEGKETMCLVDTFGKLADGELGVFVKANERQMTENLRQVPPNQLQQIRQKIAEVAPMTMDELPGVAPGVAEALDNVLEDEE
jgi:hypothetical protein